MVKLGHPNVQKQMEIPLMSVRFHQSSCVFGFFFFLKFYVTDVYYFEFFLTSSLSAVDVGYCYCAFTSTIAAINFFFFSLGFASQAAFPCPGIGGTDSACMQFTGKVTLLIHSMT